jgi:hypothetical protein
VVGYAAPAMVAQRIARLCCCALLLCCCADQPDDTGPALEVRPDGKPRLRLQQGVELDGLEVRVLADGQWQGLGSPTVTQGAGVTVLVYDNLELRVTLPKETETDGPVLVEPTLTPKSALAFQALELAVPAGGLRLPDLDTELLFLQNGYQSWSYTGVLRLQAPFSSPVAKGDDALRAGLGDPINSTKGVGWWFGLLAAVPRGPALAVGAVTAQRHRTAILPGLPAAGQASLALRIGTAGESVDVQAGATLKLEPLVLGAAGDAGDALRRYAQQVASHAAPLRDEKVADPTGWWSWNIFFDKVTEKQVLDHAAFLRDKLEPQGFALVELDDGYEVQWGEWETTDPGRFPSGLAGLSQQVRAMGLSMGLWLAPFLVDEQAPLAQSHPEWFVRDGDGKPLRHTQLGVPEPALVLDPTHPEAAKHLEDLFGRLTQAGFTLFKLDFLYAGALPGQRQAAVTGIEALNQGLELIRGAAPGAHINLCGMPVLPAVGRGHSLRFGTDIAFTVAPQGLGQIAHEARNVMLRAFLDPLIRNDPDQVLVRPPLTLDEARVAATLGAMTGFYTSGDDLTTLEPDRLQLLTHPELLGIARQARSAIPLDLLAVSSEHVYISPVADPGLLTNQPRSVPPARYYLERTDGGGPAYLALFNWGTTPQTVAVDLGALGHAGDRVKEIWEGRSFPEGGSLELTLRPHSVALLRLDPAS